MIYIERKDLIRIWKDSVIKINTKEEYDVFMELLDSMNIKFGNGKNAKDVDVWKRYNKTLGLVLTKIGREYKCGAMNCRLAQTAFHKRVIDIGDINE